MNDKIRISAKDSTVTINVEEFNRLLDKLVVEQVVMTKEKFSDSAGLTTSKNGEKCYGIVDGWIRRNYVQTVKIGRRVMIYLPGLKKQIENKINS